MKYFKNVETLEELRKTVQRTIKEVPPRQPKRKHKGNSRSQYRI